VPKGDPVRVSMSYGLLSLVGRAGEELSTSN